MQEDMTARLELIERMVLEGRQTLERWSWAYVLWGIGHVLGVVAALTLSEQRAGLAWMVLMGGCALVMAVGATLTGRRRQVETQSGRAIGAVWWAFGMLVLSLFFSPPGGTSLPAWYSIFCAAYGAAFFASGEISRWWPLKVNGLLWWAVGLAMKFLDGPATMKLFGAAAIVGEIGFGIYAMAHERKVLAGDR
jgi:hypothetical protein